MLIHHYRTSDGKDERDALYIPDTAVLEYRNESGNLKVTGFSQKQYDLRNAKEIIAGRRINGSLVSNIVLPDDLIKRVVSAGRLWNAGNGAIRRAGRSLAERLMPEE